MCELGGILILTYVLLYFLICNGYRELKRACKKEKEDKVMKLLRLDMPRMLSIRSSMDALHINRSNEAHPVELIFQPKEIRKLSLY